MNGSVELFKACKKHGVKPILGLEAYFVDDRTIREGKLERNHLTLLAQDDEGFQNLTKLSSAGFLEGLHRGKPGVDMGLLERYGKGVIALSGCLASRSSRRIVEGRLERRPRAPRRPRATSSAPRTSTSRSSATGSPSRSRSTRRSSRFAREMGRPLVATADVHYLRREDYHHHAALLCVQTKSTLAAAEDVLRHQRVLPQELGGDGGVVRRHPGGARLHAGDRRALRRVDRARRPAHPELRDAERRVRARAPARAGRRRPAPALRRPGPGGGARARRHGARA